MKHFTFPCNWSAIFTFAFEIVFSIDYTGLFSFIFGLFKQTVPFFNKSMWKMTIQCPVLGFEPTISWTWVVSHYQ